MQSIDQRWDIKHYRNGKLIWEVIEKPNRLVDTGELAVVDTFYRNKASNYFGMTDFWIGLYNGTLSEESVLSTVPGEPVGNGYARQQVERSEIGWPTMAQDENGDWQVTSKTLTLAADGGSIGPINGAFLCTSSDNSGVLIAGVSIGLSRTILAGDFVTFNIKARIR